MLCTKQVPAPLLGIKGGRPELCSNVSYSVSEENDVNRMSLATERWLLPLLVVLVAAIVITAIVTVWPPYPASEAAPLEISSTE